jgi:hypothetical protein
MPRSDGIRKIVEASPNDPFPRYGLAMALRGEGDLDGAHAEFDELERRFPDYVPQYLMHVQLLGQLGRRDDARAVGERGMAAAKRKGDGHAMDELEQALDDLS